MAIARTNVFVLAALALVLVVQPAAAKSDAELVKEIVKLFPHTPSQTATVEQSAKDLVKAEHTDNMKLANNAIQKLNFKASVFLFSPEDIICALWFFQSFLPSVKSYICTLAHPTNAPYPHHHKKRAHHKTHTTCAPSGGPPPTTTTTSAPAPTTTTTTAAPAGPSGANGVPIGQARN